jgi:hypothetical protein
VIRTLAPLPSGIASPDLSEMRTVFLAIFPPPLKGRDSRAAVELYVLVPPSGTSREVS